MMPQDAVAICVPGNDAGRHVAHIYPPREQYPLGTPRYVNDRPNLFLDVVDILDGNPPAIDDENAPIPQGSTVSLRFLAARAARASADGSGNMDRFNDGRNLWGKIVEHAARTVRTPDAPPITDVRRTHNWKKSQPMRDVCADPDAWFVSGFYARSNARKDAFHAWRGLDQVFDAVSQRVAAGAVGEGADEGARSTLESIERMRIARDGNADYPTYGQIAELVGDSNMLVFHNDASLADWIRGQIKDGEDMYQDTPVDIIVAPDPGVDEDSPSYLEPHSIMPASHLANVLSPRR